MEIHSLGAELFHADRRTVAYDEADSRFYFLFFANLANAPKIYVHGV